MAQLTRFSTHPLPREQQFPLWLDCLRHYFGDVRATARQAPGFDACIESIAERGVVVTRMRTGPQYIEHIESTAQAEHRGFVHLVFPLAGRLEVEQAGRSAVFEPGDWGIFDLSGSFRSMVERPVEMLVLAAPKAMMLGPHVDLGDCVARRFSSRGGGARIVKNFLASLLEEQGALTPELRRDFATFALQLARSNIMDVAARPSAKAYPKRSAVETYIASHLRDSELSLEDVATACGCSKRYIHKIFSAEGQTAGQYILRSRLSGSAEDLVSPELAHLSITDIAVSWGFNSSSAFSRVFRKQFKVSPKAWRSGDAR
jgi:AraC-like DNA-binding protein